MGLVRASEPLAVRDPDIEGRMTVIDPSKVYDSKHPLVRAYPWAFNDVTADDEVESATRAPGEKRLGRAKVGEEKAAGRPLTSQDNPKA
jgi:hypothetical protein